MSPPLEKGEYKGDFPVRLVENPSQSPFTERERFELPLYDRENLFPIA